MTIKDKRIDVLILAAGMGTRMKSSKPKVLHELLGKPMVGYILDAVKDLCAEPPVVVVGSGAELVKVKLGNQARFVLQDPQLGTAHAVSCAKEILKGKSDAIIVANSDFPLITTETYTALLEEHFKTGSKLTVSTVVADDPRGFGRILRDESGRIMRIVEDKEVTPGQKAIKELNSNPYCFDAEWLWKSLDKVENQRQANTT
jgi:bifunctional UDP-N-acetylglucosamine pyrophosphorylase/glucosamine-1-phosphate N-acetyltransferase